MMNNQSSQEIKQPDYIYIDGEEIPFQDKQDNDSYTHVEGLYKRKFSIFIRMISVVGAFISFLSFCIIGILVAILTGFCVITLFRSSQLKEAFYKYWTIFCKTVVLTLGFSTAVFSPSLGYSFLLLYFTMKGDKDNESLLRKILKI
ncbi:hypothetical protein BN1013_01205 [Candidatus Rubidus massiliensis]|nr:hypothetical protein BN1013_01205 [Candidatus Rubidus massiliensis]